MLERIIFAIDNDTDAHVVAKFLRHVDTKRAMMQMQPVELCVGCYKGALERSYMVLAKDFHHVADFVKNQESILRVPGDTRQPCVLEYLEGGSVVPLGPMRRVSASEALVQDAWTYYEGSYYVCDSEEHSEGVSAGIAERVGDWHPVVC
jgi:hypothetical protein